MQALSVHIEDNYIKEFMNYINNQNLQLDPYFYERKKELTVIRDAIKTGKIKMVPHEKVWENIKGHLKTIENR